MARAVFPGLTRRAWLAGCASAFLLAGCRRHEQAAEAATPAAVAKAFVELLLAGKADAAWDLTALTFRTERSLGAFQAYARAENLAGGKAGAVQPQPSPAEAPLLHVEVQEPNQRQGVVMLKLTREGGSWRIADMKVQHGAGAEPDLPARDEAEELAHRAMLKFARAIQQRDFTELYASLAIRWQKKLQQDELRAAFQSFIDKQVDLSAVSTQRPVLDEDPHIGLDRLLEIAGRYHASGGDITFRLRYVQELGQWKLFGLDVHLVPATKPK